MMLLSQLADQARLSDDLAFAVRAQSQAATLLWPLDRERARAIFRRAFDSLAPDSSLKTDANLASVGVNKSSAPPSVDKRQLRTEMLNQIANRDPGLAEELARALAYPVEDPTEENFLQASKTGVAASGDYEQAIRGPAASFITVSTRADNERRELLISVALQIVERDPYRAMALGQLSLAAGISPNFARLLMLMRATDAGLADLLFTIAVANFERSQVTDLSAVHTLGSYLVSIEHSAAKKSISKSVIARFLNLAFNQIMRRSADLPLADSAASDSASRNQSAEMETAAAYFTVRQLKELFARYLPSKLLQLQRKVADLNDASSLDAAIDLNSNQTSGPADIAREAHSSSDENERNLLYARAALAWLAKGDVEEAQTAASQISEAEMRDRVLAQIARRQTSQGRIDDAVAVAQHIEDDTARVAVLVRLAGAALASKDRVRATELLNEAETEAIKAQPSLARAQSLLTIVGSFSSFDLLRAFEVMQTAMKAINEITVKDASAAATSNARALTNSTPAVKADELHHLDFESTLASLARADFDRALLLAQQLNSKETAIIAQLAVCHGGLAPAFTRPQSADEDEVGGNH